MTEPRSSKGEQGRTRSELARMIQQAVQEASCDPEDDVDGSPSGASNPSATIMQQAAESYSGSFPHPDVLRSLDGVVENGAERAFALTEREQEHRQKLDESMVNADIEHVRRLDQDRRMLIIFAAVLLLLSLVGGFVAVMAGHPAGLSVAGVSALASLGVGLFAGRKNPTGPPS